MPVYNRNYEWFGCPAATLSRYGQQKSPSTTTPMRFASQVELYFGRYRELAWVETDLSQYGNDDLVDAAALSTYHRIRKLLYSLHGYRMDAADAEGDQFSDVTSYLEENRAHDYYAERETIGLIERRLKAEIALHRAAFAHAEARAEIRARRRIAQEEAA